MLNLDCTPSLHWCKVSECLTQWMFTWREMNKRADISLALTTVSITSESLMWNGLKVSFWTAVYSTTVAGVHDNTRALCHTQLCHPWKQEEVGLVEDSSHVVAMATAPPGRQDKRRLSKHSATCICFKEVASYHVVLFKWWKYITGFPRLSRSRPQHWATRECWKSYIPHKGV